jgi:hypothetical protein
MVHYRYDLESTLRLFACKALAGAILSLIKGQTDWAKEYLWLFWYRRERQAYFDKMKQERPQQLALLHED